MVSQNERRERTRMSLLARWKSQSFIRRPIVEEVIHLYCHILLVGSKLKDAVHT